MISTSPCGSCLSGELPEPYPLHEPRLPLWLSLRHVSLWLAMEFDGRLPKKRSPFTKLRPNLRSLCRHCAPLRCLSLLNQCEFEQKTMRCSCGVKSDLKAMTHMTSDNDIWHVMCNVCNAVSRPWIWTSWTHWLASLATGSAKEVESHLVKKKNSRPAGVVLCLGSDLFTVLKLHLLQMSSGQFFRRKKCQALLKTLEPVVNFGLNLRYVLSPSTGQSSRCLWSSPWPEKVIKVTWQYPSFW